MSQEELGILSIIVASLGFLISFATLYFTYLIGPKIKVSVGPYVKIYHGDYNLGCATGIYLPITFFNNSSRAALIKKTAIELHKKGDEQKRYFMHWEAFSDFNADKNNWNFKEFAYSIPILGKSSMQKTGWYYWSAKNEEKLIFEEGTYIFDFIYWQDRKDKPFKESHEILIDSETAMKMKEYIESQVTTIVDIVLDKEMTKNKLISSTK